MYREEHWQDPSREGIRVNIEEVTKQNRGGNRVNQEMLREACLKNGGYENPLLNNSLCLNYRGLAKIEQLESYRNLHCLYLDCNGITRIEGLDELTNLKSLYLQSNCLTRMENLPSSLVVLDLRENKITEIENLENCTQLSQLNLSKNSLMTVNALKGLLPLVEKPENQLVSIDVSANYIEEEDPLVEFFVDGEEKRFKNVDCIFLQSNPSVRRIKNYRRRLVAGLPRLKFLDTKQVTEVERVGVQGWLEDGPEGEQTAKRGYYMKEREEKQRDLERFRKVQEQANKKLQKQLKRQAAEKARKEAFDAGEGVPEGCVERTPMPEQDWVMVGQGENKGETTAAVGDPPPKKIVSKGEKFSSSSSTDTLLHQGAAADGKKSDEMSTTVDDRQLTSENVGKLPFSKLDPAKLHLMEKNSSSGSEHQANPDIYVKVSPTGETVESDSPNKPFVATMGEQQNACCAVGTNFQDARGRPSESSFCTAQSQRQSISSCLTDTENPALSVDSTGAADAMSASAAPSESVPGVEDWYWSKLRDERLERLVAKSGYRFSTVAQKLNAEFNSTTLTERMARERYGALLRKTNLCAVPEDEAVTTASSDASPADFQQMDAQRDRTRWWVRKLNSVAKFATSASSSSTSSFFNRDSSGDIADRDDIESICTEDSDAVSDATSTWISPEMCLKDFDNFASGQKSALLAEAQKRGKQWGMKTVPPPPEPGSTSAAANATNSSGATALTSKFADVGGYFSAAPPAPDPVSVDTILQHAESIGDAEEEKGEQADSSTSTSNGASNAFAFKPPQRKNLYVPSNDLEELD
ncbi:unnamed protein product [Amoebophrya sp. A120]|nr:unnamed protein product [Amoebophrya sp. A120]|eukprot:GSA120T00024055001.1